jgi:mycothiol synthase
MSAGLAITPLPVVGDDVAAVEKLVRDAAAIDGFSAINEAAHLHLHHPRPQVRHLLAWLDARLVGYAQLEEAPSGEDVDTGQLVVDPAYRGRGIGAGLLDCLLGLSKRRLQIWAMADTPAARTLAASRSLLRHRELLIMKRSLIEPLPESPAPDGVTIRAFRMGTDEAAWLALNARAFAGHPEQGRLDRTDLEERMSEPWFDPDGFLVAERSGVLIGFHWTKQQPDRLGEVYVLGVDPQAAGGGVGKALLIAGLRHLRARGNTEVELYVESDHRTAVGLYARAGFTESSRDVLYRQPVA